MANKYCDRTVPNVSSADLPDDHVLKTKGELLGAQVAKAYETIAFSQACELILGLVRIGNKYIDEQAPWALYKQGQHESVAKVLYSVLETVRQAAYLLSPIVPHISTAVYEQLGYTTDFNDREAVAKLSYAVQAEWGVLPAGQALGLPQPVFRRLDPL
jgi:methionyl-tRNA synthetase